MRIPLFRQGQQPPSRAPKIQTPLGDTRAMRINMGGIDRGIIADFSSEPEADPRPFVRQAAAASAVGEAMQDASNVLGRLALAKAETINRLDRAEAESKLDAAFADFEKWKQETNADPRTWGEEWARRSEGLEAVAIHEKMAPAVQDELRESLVRFRARSTIQIETAATKRLFELDGERVKANFYRAVDEGDLPKANAAIEEGVSLGLLGEDDGVRMGIDAREGVKAKKNEEVIDGLRGFYSDNPDAAQFLLEAGNDDAIWGDLDNGQKNQLRGEALREQNRVQSSTLDILLEESAKGKVLSRPTVMKMVEDKRLDIRSAENYLAHVERENPTPDDPERVVEVLAAIDSYYKEPDPTGDRIVALQQSMVGFSPERTNYFQQRLAARRKEFSGEAPVHPHAGTGRQAIYEALAMGVFGATTKQVKEKIPTLDGQGNPIPNAFTWQTKNVRDPEKRKEARLLQADALDKFDRWLADPANMNKSRREVEAFAQSLLPKAPGLSTGAGAILGEDLDDPEGDLSNLLDNPLFDGALDSPP